MNQDKVKELFEYKNGNLYRKVKSLNNKFKIGDLAGTIGCDGYRTIQINKKQYKAHRLIFLMFNGFMPEEIDHIDTNKLNNKIENLRVATRSQNSCNQKIRKDNISGVKGVCWHKVAKKWVVQISIDGVRKRFGLYNDIDYAKFVAEAIRYKYHNEFARK